ncbi:hypothetical protein CTV99_00150 [Bacillus pumilus]|uniref:Uncharacterized protein n=1 Tax=Bacillus pumilus TaxID=1408 RepID=A0A2G8IYD5_BACPU|nr:hypothetical protein CTV99_00150 [Bacillus pumilus]
MSGLRSVTHECQIRSVPVLALPRLQRFSITQKRRQSEDRTSAVFSLCIFFFFGWCFSFLRRCFFCFGWF